MAPKTPLSKERVVNSSSDESSDESSSKTQKATKIHTQKSSTISATIEKANKHSSNDEADDSTSSDDNSAANSDHENSQSTRSSVSENSSSSNKRKVSSAGVAGKPAKRAKIHVTDSGLAGARRVEAPQYNAPPGYAALKNMTPLPSMFENLKAKKNEVWHISAPSTLPMDAVREIDLQAGLAGGVVAKHKGVSYGLRIADVENTTLLIPREQANGVFYTPISGAGSLTRSIIIHEVPVAPKGVDLALANDLSRKVPEVDGEVENDATDTKVVSTERLEDELIFTASKTGTMPPPRAQPKLLGGRWTPYGVEEIKNNPIIHDVEMLDVGAPSEIPTTPKSSKKSKKHHSDTLNSQQETNPARSSSKKSRKDRHKAQEQVIENANDAAPPTNATDMLDAIAMDNAPSENTKQNLLDLKDPNDKHDPSASQKSADTPPKKKKKKTDKAIGT